MRILFNASMYTEKSTGVGIYTREILKAMYESNLPNKDVVIYTYYKDELPSGIAIKMIRLPWGMEQVLVKHLSLHRIVWNIFVLPTIAKKYDLVYSFSSHGSPFLKKQIITIHDLICFAFPQQHKTQYYYFKYLIPYIIKASRKIVTISHYSKNEILCYYKMPNDKVAVIPAAGDHLKKKSGTITDPSEKKMQAYLMNKSFFLVVGATYSHKNVETAIEAFTLANTRDLLIITGADTVYFRYLQAQYVSDTILFVNYASNSMLNFFYRHCVANLYVSLYEGMGMPPYEAAMYDKVSIASNATAIPETYEFSVYSVSPDNVQQIKEAIILFSQNKVDQSQYKQHFPKLFAKYTWQKTAKKNTALIQDVFEKLYRPNS